MSAVLKPIDGGPGAPRHFLEIMDFDSASLRRMLDLGSRTKRGEVNDKPLAGKNVALLFEKPSTRTRVSFDVGVRQMGGQTMVLSGSEMQLGHGETIADTARVLSRYVDAIMIRTGDPAKLRELAEHASVPVINGLTDRSHPCQVMADLMTFEEHRGPLAGKLVAWVGDGNNVSNSWIHAAAHFGFRMRLACPASLGPSPDAVAWARGKGAAIEITEDPAAAARDADLVMTDTWVSMGFTDPNRPILLAPYQVNAALMARAKPDALFMHCLPVHRGEEVTEEVLDGPQSVVWDEAENRLHVQKGVLTWCLL